MNPSCHPKKFHNAIPEVETQRQELTELTLNMD
jgi:NAD-dependent SIR2 family protein deacetylase